MQHTGFAFYNWIPKLENNFVLRTVCGFSDKLPTVASSYDFINRIIHLDERPRLKLKNRKPSKKTGKGKKSPLKRPGIVPRLVDNTSAGRRFNYRPELLLQQIFANVCVKKSFDLGLVPHHISISGDGTCIKSGASSLSVKTCDCTRLFADPNATWGWDSHKEQGYSWLLR